MRLTTITAACLRHCNFEPKLAFRRRKSSPEPEGEAKLREDWVGLIPGTATVRKNGAQYSGGVQIDILKVEKEQPVSDEFAGGKPTQAEPAQVEQALR